jgi:integrase
MITIALENPECSSRPTRATGSAIKDTSATTCSRPSGSLQAANYWIGRRSSGHPIEPRNINRAFDLRCARYGVRRITLHDTRRTCGSLLAALDVHPRIAMAILRHSRISLTIEIYTQVPAKETRDTLRRLSDWLDHDEDQS